MPRPMLVSPSEEPRPVCSRLHTWRAKPGTPRVGAFPHPRRMALDDVAGSWSSAARMASEPDCGDAIRTEGGIRVEISEADRPRDPDPLAAHLAPEARYGVARRECSVLLEVRSGNAPL